MAIDWAEPVYLHGTHVPLVHMATQGEGSSRPFHGFVDPMQPERGWLYYNDDGTPFAAGQPFAPEPVSNTPGYDPRQLELPDPAHLAMCEAVAWGMF